MTVLPATNTLIKEQSDYITVLLWVVFEFIRMHIMHEQSYYIVHYIRRKEEGRKEERNEQTPTIYNSLEGLDKYICVHTPSFSSFEKYIHTHSPIILENYFSLTSMCMYMYIHAHVHVHVHVHVYTCLSNIHGSSPDGEELPVDP